jgi:hypothetical protein
MICISCKKEVDDTHGHTINDNGTLEFMCNECIKTYKKFGCDY